MVLINISARMLKTAVSITAASIAKLFNFSLTHQFFLSAGRMQNGLLFKGGDPENVNNYRPMTVLSIFSKEIERHVQDSLYSYLCDNNLIYS